MIEQTPLARIDYVDLVDAETLQMRDTLNRTRCSRWRFFFGKTRLIDNIRLP